jgi:TetR/AcrR family transcriptional regulator
MTEQDRETSERILDAAHAVFLRRGTAAARTQEIAAEAGVNKALLHYYFGTKEALAEAVFTRAASMLFPQIFAIFRADRPLEEKVPELIATYLDFLSARPYLVGYIITELHSHPHRAQRLLPPKGALPLDVLQRQIAERIAAGAMRPIAPEQFLVNLIALMVFPFVARPILAQLLDLDAPRFAAFIDERKRTLADFFFNALRP